MLARCTTAALQGLEARPVLVEVDLAPGLPGLQLVGLADAAVQEARERVRSAIRHSSLKVPLTRVVVTLGAPRALVGAADQAAVQESPRMAAERLATAHERAWLYGSLALQRARAPVRSN